MKKWNRCGKRRLSSTHQKRERAKKEETVTWSRTNVKQNMKSERKRMKRKKEK